MRRGKGFSGGNGNYPGELAGVLEYEATDTYFVPSFSIRRHITTASENKIAKMQRDVQGILGRGFTAVEPAALTLKVINQRQLIRRMRAAELHPSSDEVRDLAFSIRNGLIDVLKEAPTSIPVPLGQLGLFGYMNQALAVTLQGWGGYHANYATHDNSGLITPQGELITDSMTPYGALVSEVRYCTDAIYGRFPELQTHAEGEQLVSTPHMTIARNYRDIHSSRLRNLERSLAPVLEEEVEMGDPIIEFRASRDAPPEIMYVRHAWETLAAS